VKIARSVRAVSSQKGIAIRGPQYNPKGLPSDGDALFFVENNLIHLIHRLQLRPHPNTIRI
jgi:hypothetical protein